MKKIITSLLLLPLLSYGQGNFPIMPNTDTGTIGGIKVDSKAQYNALPSSVSPLMMPPWQKVKDTLLTKLDTSYARKVDSAYNQTIVGGYLTNSMLGGDSLVLITRGGAAGSYSYLFTSYSYADSSTTPANTSTIYEVSQAALSYDFFIGSGAVPLTVRQGELDSGIVRFGYASGVWNKYLTYISGNYVSHAQYDTTILGVTYNKRLSIPVSSTNGYINKNTGALTLSANWRNTDYFTVNEGDQVVWVGTVAATGSLAAPIARYDASKVFLGWDSVLSGSTYVIPLGVSFIRASARMLGGDVFSVDKKSLLVKTYRVDGLPELIAQVGQNTVGLSKLITQKNFALSGLTVAYLNIGGATVPSGNWRTTDYVSVAPGDVVTYTGNTAGGAAQAIVGYNNSKVFSSVILGTLSTKTTTTATIPTGVYFIRASGRMLAGDTLVLIAPSVEVAADSVNYDNITKTRSLSYASIGTSITYQDGKAYATGPESGQIAIGYQTHLLRQLKLNTYYNYGYSGNSLTAVNPDDGLSIIRKRGLWNPAQLYTVELPTNDFKLNRSLGDTSDYINNTGDTTFYGAYRILIDFFYSTSPSCNIVLFTGLQRNNSGYTSFSINSKGFSLNDYNNAIRYIGKRESIPIVDLFYNSGINLKNISQYTYDGLHPMDIGYDQMSTQTTPVILNAVR